MGMGCVLGDPHFTVFTWDDAWGDDWRGFVLFGMRGEGYDLRRGCC